MALQLVTREPQTPRRRETTDLEVVGWFCWELGKIGMGIVVGWVFRSML